ncbi:unnamed protein product, partial [marine sediment metagenome]
VDIIKPFPGSFPHPVILELKPPFPCLGVVKQNILEPPEGPLTADGYLQ